MVLGLVVAQLVTLGEFDAGVRRNTLQAIMSHRALSFSGDWSLGVDWEIGGLEETGWTKLVLGWEAQESWKRT